MKSKIMYLFEQAGLLNDKNNQILEFGITRLVNGIMDWMFAIVCAAIMGNIVVGIVFELGYIILRIYAGGYHAGNKKRCFYLTYASTLLSIAGTFYIPFSTKIICGVILIADIIIILTVPVESANKPLNKIEHKVFRRNAICIAFMESGICLVFLGVNMILYARAVCVVMILVTIGLVAEIAKKYTVRKKGT